MAIVTGLVDLGRWESRQRSCAEYIAQAKSLLSCPFPLILFSDADNREELLSLRPKQASTHWLDAEFHPSEDELAVLTQGLEKSTIPWNPSKDTARYFCLMREKVRWLRRAALINPFASECLWWIDIGYLHTTYDDLERVLSKAPPVGQIRLGELSYVPRTVREDRHRFYYSHWWPVGGGVLAARPAEFEWLDEQLDAEWRWTIEHHMPVTDEMMLGFIRYQHPERFDVYYADHCSLLTNYIAARDSHPLIVAMAKRALEDGNVVEAAARLNAIVPHIAV
jgi:hypothetical protein